MNGSFQKGSVLQLLGCGLGLILAYVWVFFIIFLGFAFLATTTYYANGTSSRGFSSGPIITWISLGAFPFFIILGHFLLYANGAGGEDRANDVRLFKGFAGAFLVWLIAAAIVQWRYVDVYYTAASGLFLAGGYVLTIMAFFIAGVNWKCFLSYVLAIVLFVMAMARALGYFHIAGLG